MKAKTTFEPAVVGGIEVQNRIFRSATYEGAARDGKVSDQMIEMYNNLAKGEVGLIITGWIGVSGNDQPGARTVVLTDDSSISGLERLTGTVHLHGRKIIAQLNHASSQIFSPPKGPVYAPSDVTDPLSGIKPTPFTKEQVQELIAEFGDAAVRAKKARFDGVQIHGAHGYLLNKFLSPAFNKRTDEYGGSSSKNIRIVLEILHEIKTRCGKDFPVWIKLNCSDFDPAGQGLNEEHFLTIAKELAQNGIDAIEVSGGSFSAEYSPCRHKSHAAYHLEYAKRLTEVVD
ncbi:MAG: NADH:flavin oxidoreductase, partial [Desulfomonile sp.]